MMVPACEKQYSVLSCSQCIKILSLCSTNELTLRYSTLLCSYITQLIARFHVFFMKHEG
jgi:hypothetical protein